MLKCTNAIIFQLSLLPKLFSERVFLASSAVDLLVLFAIIWYGGSAPYCTSRGSDPIIVCVC